VLDDSGLLECDTVTLEGTGTMILQNTETTHSTTQHHFPENLNSRNLLLQECLTGYVHLYHSNVLNEKDDSHM
jgi:carbamoylphosphate synthase large subunit